MKTIPYIFGVPIIVDTRLPDEPRFELSDKVTVPAGFRHEFDQWARDFFGTEAPYRMVNVNGVETVVTNLRGLDELQGASEVTS